KITIWPGRSLCSGEVKLLSSRSTSQSSFIMEYLSFAIAILLPNRVFATPQGRQDRGFFHLGIPTSFIPQYAGKMQRNRKTKTCAGGIKPESRLLGGTPFCLMPAR